MDYHDILEISSLAGKIMLENGGEIYRVEETIVYVGRALGAADCESYAYPTAVMTTVSDDQGRMHSVMRRIGRRTVNLDKVDAVNRFSRRLEKNPASMEEIRAQLGWIGQRGGYSLQVVALASALAAGAFAFVFGGGVREGLCALVTGGLLRILVLLLQRIRLNDFFINLAGGALATLGGWISAALGLSTDPEVISISALMLLVPGLLITNAVRDIAAGDLVSGASRSIEAFFVAVALACGTGLAYLLMIQLGGMRL